MFKRFTRYLEYYGRCKTLQVLRELSDRQLGDAGISRQLVNEGVGAYPWREGEATIPLAPIKPKAYCSKSFLRKAEKELRAMSNHELADIGISRGQIPFAVRYGRI